MFYREHTPDYHPLLVLGYMLDCEVLICTVIFKKGCAKISLTVHEHNSLKPNIELRQTEISMDKMLLAMMLPMCYIFDN